MRPSGLLLTALFVLPLAACSSVTERSIELTREDVVFALVDQGLDAALAECSVGLGEREFELTELMPGSERTANDEALIAELVASCQDAAAILDTEPTQPERLALDDGPVGYGDDARLDGLWDRCERGDGAACDRLWEEAPVDSEYEEFGVTCGGRPDLLDCTEELIFEPAERE